MKIPEFNIPDMSKVLGLDQLKAATEAFQQSPLIRQINSVQESIKALTPAYDFSGIKHPYYSEVIACPPRINLDFNRSQDEIVVVIGNGFDLEAGLDTGYSDFRKSNQWDRLMSESSLKCFMQQFFQTKGKDSWLGLEEEFKRYAVAIQSLNQDPIQYAENVKRDQVFFTALCSALKEYLKSCYRKIDSSKYSYLLLKTLLTVSDYYFDIKNKHPLSVRYITFNYTELSQIAYDTFEKGYPSSLKEVTHVHGKLDDDIILGTDESQDIPYGYEFLFKSWHEKYQSHVVLEELAQASKIIFFGLSFGAIDLVYFYKFFRDICSGRYDENLRKNITIITKDNESRMSIMREIYKMGIPIMELKAHCNLKFIYTYVDRDKNQDFRDLLTSIQTKWKNLPE